LREKHGAAETALARFEERAQRLHI
jgi:hypothetical protein